jgi:hypothetical protein
MKRVNGKEFENSIVVWSSLGSPNIAEGSRWKLAVFHFASINV